MEPQTKKRKLSPTADVDTSKPTIRQQHVESKAKTGISDLPKELLVQIIGHALITPKPITLRKPEEHRWAKEIESLRQMQNQPGNNSYYSTSRKRTRKSPLVKVLLACKDFYFAGLEAYYGGNTFHFDTLLDFRDVFLERLSDRHKVCVKNVVVDWEWYYMESIRKGLDYFPSCSWALREDMLKDLPNLETATISCRMRREPVYLAAASRANYAKEYISGMVLAAWKSKNEDIWFVYPETWGVLKDM